MKKAFINITILSLGFCLAVLYALSLVTNFNIVTISAFKVFLVKKSIVLLLSIVTVLAIILLLFYINKNYYKKLSYAIFSTLFFVQILALITNSDLIINVLIAVVGVTMIASVILLNYTFSKNKQENKTEQVANKNYSKAFVLWHSIYISLFLLSLIFTLSTIISKGNLIIWVPGLLPNTFSFMLFSLMILFSLLSTFSLSKSDIKDNITFSRTYFILLSLEFLTTALCIISSLNTNDLRLGEKVLLIVAIGIMIVIFMGISYLLYKSNISDYSKRLKKKMYIIKVVSIALIIIFISTTCVSTVFFYHSDGQEIVCIDMTVIGMDCNDAMFKTWYWPYELKGLNFFKKMTILEGSPSDMAFKRDAKFDYELDMNNVIISEINSGRIVVFGKN